MREKLLILIVPVIAAVITQITNITVVATCGCKSLVYGFPFPYMSQRVVYSKELACLLAACPNEKSFSLVYFIIDSIIWGFIAYLVLKIFHKIKQL